MEISCAIGFFPSPQESPPCPCHFCQKSSYYTITNGSSHCPKASPSVDCLLSQPASPPLLQFLPDSLCHPREMVVLDTFLSSQHVCIPFMSGDYTMHTLDILWHGPVTHIWYIHDTFQYQLSFYDTTMLHSSIYNKSQLHSWCYGKSMLYAIDILWHDHVIHPSHMIDKWTKIIDGRLEDERLSLSPMLTG